MLQEDEGAIQARQATRVLAPAYQTAHVAQHVILVVINAHYINATAVYLCRVDGLQLL